MASAPSGSGAAMVTSKGAGTRRTFKHSADDTVCVTDGYMSLDDADTVMLKVMESWGFTSTDESTRSDIVAKMSQLLQKGTSHERNFSAVWFEHNNVRCYLEDLKFQAGLYDKSENPVRVFARSYRKGEIPIRIHDMLKDPENPQLREKAVLDYSATLDLAHLCFDVADALPNYPGMKLAQTERMFITISTANKVRESRSMFIGGNDGGSVQQVSSNVSAGKGGPSPVLPNPSSSFIKSGNVDQRAGFGAMR